MQNKPTTLAIALAQVRGTHAAEQPQPPATLQEALAIMRQTEAAPPPSPAEEGKDAKNAKSEPLPGLRAWIQERRRNGR